MKHTDTLIELYYDADFYLGGDNTFKNCFKGTMSMVHRIYEEVKSEYAADLENGTAHADEDPGTFDEWFGCLYGQGWWDYELGFLSDGKKVYPYYFIPKTEELKTAAEVYADWQAARDINNPHDTFAAFMNGQAYGIDDPKED